MGVIIKSSTMGSVLKAVVFCTRFDYSIINLLMVLRSLLLSCSTRCSVASKLPVDWVGSIPETTSVPILVLFLDWYSFLKRLNQSSVVPS